MPFELGLPLLRLLTRAPEFQPGSGGSSRHLLTKCARIERRYAHKSQNCLILAVWEPSVRISRGQAHVTVRLPADVPLATVAILEAIPRACHPSARRSRSGDIIIRRQCHCSSSLQVRVSTTCSRDGPSRSFFFPLTRGTSLVSERLPSG
jgi:hypothetical protein